MLERQKKGPHTFYRRPEQGVDRFESRRRQAGLLQAFHRVVTQGVEHVAPVVHEQLERGAIRGFVFERPCDTCLESFLTFVFCCC